MKWKGANKGRKGEEIEKRKGKVLTNGEQERRKKTMNTAPPVLALVA
jgi:hypothetical protein